MITTKPSVEDEIEEKDPSSSIEIKEEVELEVDLTCLKEEVDIGQTL